MSTNKPTSAIEQLRAGARRYQVAGWDNQVQDTPKVVELDLAEQVVGELEQENAKLQKQWDDLEIRRFGEWDEAAELRAEVVKRNIELTRQVEVLREALEHIKSGGEHPSDLIAAAALSEPPTVGVNDEVSKETNRN